jgi:hypothetical protein
MQVADKNRIDLGCRNADCGKPRGRAVAHVYKYIGLANYQ